MKRWFLDPAHLSLWAGSLALAMFAGCGQEAEGPGQFVAPPDARPVAYHKEQVIIAEGPITEFENPFMQDKAEPDSHGIQQNPTANVSASPREPQASAKSPAAASNDNSPSRDQGAQVTQAPLLSLSPFRPDSKPLSVGAPKTDTSTPAEGPVLLIDPRSGTTPSNGDRDQSPQRIPATSSPTPADRNGVPHMERTPPVLLLGEHRKSNPQASSSLPWDSPRQVSPPQALPSSGGVVNRPSENSAPIERSSVDTVVMAPAQPPAASPELAPSRSQLLEKRGVVDRNIPTPVLEAPIPMKLVPMAPNAADVRTMDAVRMRAYGLVENGMSLAHRGAYYSARAEFIQAMRLITQTLDTQRSTREHSAALSSGLVALDEASAFIPEGANLEADLDLPMIIGSHRTPSLKGEALDEITPLAAVQAYFSYAQERLRFAAGGVPEASQALFGLAKLQQYLHGGESENRALIGPRSIALYQTALSIDPAHAEAANELGVLLARYGQYEDAKQALLQGLRSRPYAESWNNLARVHELLGETELALLARQEAAAPRSHGGNQVVRWTTPDEFTDEGRPTLQQPSQATSRPAESTARGGSRAASRR